MVKAIIDIAEEANQVINIVKAKFGLRTKSEAINVMAEEYASEILEPELRPEYIEKALRIRRQKPIHVGTVKNLRKRYES